MKPLKNKELCKKFNEIKDYYIRLDKKKQNKGDIRKSTKYGIFGASDCDIVFDLFRLLELQKHKNFIDLGSGDGRVVLIASLFTPAVGIEVNKKLNNLAKKAKKDLRLEADFRSDDFFKENLSKYGALYVYPSKKDDKKFRDKILNELNGLLVVYKIYFPNYLKKMISFVDEYLRINCYRNPKHTAS